MATEVNFKVLLFSLSTIILIHFQNIEMFILSCTEVASVISQVLQTIAPSWISFLKK